MFQMSGFLTVKTKTTNEVDFCKPLNSFVNSIPGLSKDSKAEAKEALVQLNRLRHNACVQPVDKLHMQQGLDQLTRYYDQLCAMSTKIPICPTMNPINFRWTDAFDRVMILFSNGPLTKNDVAYERQAVLFNCGAFMSQMAAGQPQNSDDELKTMAKLFQQAAGVFSKVGETVLGLSAQELSPDLSPETLAALSTLMLAQAQEAIYIKGAKDQMKPAALVKISAQCSEFYGEAHRLMKSTSAIKKIWESEWLQTVSGKGAAYSAIAQFYQAQVSVDNKEYGEQVARFTEAQRLVTSNSFIAKNFPTESAAIKKAFEQASKDNNFIYHARVPELKTLPALPTAALVKALPVVSPLSPSFQDLFETCLTPQPKDNRSLAAKIFDIAKNILN